MRTDDERRMRVRAALIGAFELFDASGFRHRTRRFPQGDHAAESG
jgi:hypothetical protein